MADDKDVPQWLTRSVIENFKTCTYCGGPLKLIEWNTTTSILVCDDPLCKKYRTPIVPPSDRPKKQKEPQLPAWLSPEDNSFSGRLSRNKARLDGKFNDFYEDD